MIAKYKMYEHKHIVNIKIHEKQTYFPSVYWHFIRANDNSSNHMCCDIPKNSIVIILKTK